MIEISYLILAIFYLFIGLYSSLFLFFKDKIIRQVSKKFLFLFAGIGVCFLIKSILFFLVVFEKISFNLTDLYFINPILLFILTSFLVFIFGILFNNPNLKYSLFFYFIVFLSFFFSSSFYAIFFFVSYALIILISLLAFIKKDFLKLSISGAVYSVLSLLLIAFLKLGFINIFVFEILTSASFLVFLFYLFKSIKKNIYNIKFHKKIFHERNFVLDFLRYFLFVILLMFFVFISTVAIHELGHFAVSKFFDCSLSKIVYQGSLPHTEVLCQNQDSNALLFSILGGVLFPFLIAIIFFFIGGRFMKEIGISIFGFNFLLAYTDFIDLGLTKTTSLFFSILGIVLLILAIAMLANSRVEEKSFLSLAQGEKTFYTNKY